MIIIEIILSEFLQGGLPVTVIVNHEHTEETVSNYKGWI
jgi:hypothetical protein